MTTRPHRLQKTLLVSLLLGLLLTACKSDQEPTAPPTQTLEPPIASATAPPASETAAPMQPASATPTERSSPTASGTDHASATPLPLTTHAALPTPTVSTPNSSIDDFSVEVADSGTGKRLTFAWETTGANRVNIQSGTSQRPAPIWDVPSDGTITVELPFTKYRNPPMTLWAYSEPDHLSVEQVVSRTINYDESLWEWYPDTWSADQPEGGPGIVPPEGLVQPVGGFGKVWRENPEVRERLGWGLAPEQGYNAELQVPIREAFPGAVFVRTFVDGVIELMGWRFGIWRFVAP